MNENKIDIILNSAEELMCSMAEPNKDITVDMIAKNAGIGKGSIYYYFESKEDIFDAVIERSYSAAIRDFFLQSVIAVLHLKNSNCCFVQYCVKNFWTKAKM